jgi:hypothetical protein
MGVIYTSNKKMNKNIAMGILGAVLLDKLGILRALNINLASMTLPLVPISVIDLLLIGGTAWIIWGLHNREIGA